MVAVCYFSRNVSKTDQNFGSFLCNLTTCGIADEMYVLSASNKRVSIQLVGKDKVQDKLSRFEELTGASLSFLGLSSPGSPGDIGNVLPSK